MDEEKKISQVKVFAVAILCIAVYTAIQHYIYELLLWLEINYNLYFLFDNVLIYFLTNILIYLFAYIIPFFILFKIFRHANVLIIYNFGVAAIMTYLTIKEIYEVATNRDFAPVDDSFFYLVFHYKFIMIDLFINFSIFVFAIIFGLTKIHELKLKNKRF